MKAEEKLGAVIAYLDEDTIQDAGFDVSNITPDQFKQIRMRIERYIDQGWQGIVFDACHGVLPTQKS
ncbi:MAG: hypothetical protein EBR82_76825 [Caulobacteraceae bacterium]|nr:hypothetical protein [Caulobacteraceae bacterium]